MVWRMTNATDGDAPRERRLGGLFDDKEINIAVARGLTVRVRAEENNLFGTIFFFEPRDDVVNDAACV